MAIAYNNIFADHKAREGRIEAAVPKAAYIHNREAKGDAPVDTGRYRASIRVEREGEMVWVDMTDVEYGPAIEFGSRVHIIRPRDARALRWFEGGEPVFATIVRHPGTAPNPVMRRAYESTLKKVKAMFAGVG